MKITAFRLAVLALIGLVAAITLAEFDSLFSPLPLILVGPFFGYVAGSIDE